MATEAERCPNEAQLLAFFEGTLRFRARKKVVTHLAGCDRCRESLTLLTRLASGEAARPAERDERDDNIKDQAARVLRMVQRTEDG